MEITLGQIITWAGGTSVVISAIGYLIGQLVIINRTEKWKVETGAKLKILENQLSEKSQLLNNLIDIQKSSYNLSQDKRLKSLTEIWQTINEFLLEMPDSFIYINNLNDVMLSKYFEKEEFPAGKDIVNDLKELDKNEEFADLFKKLRNNIIFYRPFLGEELYLAFQSYFTFILRVFLHTWKCCEDKKITSWKNDSVAINLLSKVANEEDYAKIIKITKNSFENSVKIFERHVLEIIQLHISGKSASESTMKHLQEIKEILDQNDIILKKPQL